MTVGEAEQDRPKKSWYFYFVSSVGILVTVLLVAAGIYFRNELQYVQGYGYAGIFIIGVLCGISIIPAPTLLAVFTLSSVLNPIFVGLIAGFGAAIGGITVYLTGASAGTIWSKLRSNPQTTQHQGSPRYDAVEQIETRFWSKGEVLYNRLLKWVGGKGGALVLFISSAMIISPYYFAGLAAGSLRMGLLKFFLISWAGKTVRYLTVAFAGYWGLRSLLQWIGS